MIGSESGTVRLCEHDKQWETEALNTIARLKNILGDVIRDIQHVGSTAIFNIKAKPIIDIAIAVDDFDDVLKCEKQLEAAGFFTVPTRRKRFGINCSLPAEAIMTAPVICRRILYTWS